MRTNAKRRLSELLERGPNLSRDFHDNHHLHRRGRVWHTVLTVCGRQRSKRLQRSLRTTNVVEARQRRDALIDKLIEENRVVPLRARTRT
jgi:hypothetical protein